MSPGYPTTLLAEITHRCPLHCPYCSNPMELVRAQEELSTADWKRVRCFASTRSAAIAWRWISPMLGAICAKLK